MRFKSLSFRHPGIQLPSGLSTIVREKDGWTIEADGQWLYLTPRDTGDTLAVPRENVTHGVVERRGKTKASRAA